MMAGRVVWIAVTRVTEAVDGDGRGPVRVHKAASPVRSNSRSLMATTYAHAGNSISFEIDGHDIRIEVPTADGITTPRSR